MGVVIRQSAKQSVIAFAGILIGAVNVLFIYPSVFSAEELGLLRFIIDTGTLCMPFVLLGMNQVNVKYYPSFKTNDGRNNGLLAFCVLAILISAGIFSILIGLFSQPIYKFYTGQNPLYDGVLFVFLPLGILMAYYLLLTSVSQNFKRIAIPQFFNQLYPKIGLPILGLMYYWGIIGFKSIFLGVIAIYIFINLSHLIYIQALKQLHLNWDFKKFLNKEKTKEILNFAAFALLTNLGAMVVMRIDSFMVSTLSSLTDNGVYTIGAFIANAISAPLLAILGITAPLVAQAFKDNQVEEIEVLYKKSSLNLLIIGGALLICVFVGIDYLFDIMPNGEVYRSGKWVIFILGFSKLFDMATSINQHIIQYSKFFRFNFYALLFLSVFNIVCNWFFIPLYSIEGAAMASLLSLGLFNIVKLAYIYYKFKIQPFNFNSLIVLVLGVSITLLINWLPVNFHPVLNLIVKCGLAGGLFLGLVLWLKLSKDLNKMIGQILSKFIK